MGITKQEINSIVAELDKELRKGADEATTLLKAEGEKEDVSSPAEDKGAGDSAPDSGSSSTPPPPGDASAGGPPPPPDASAGADPADPAAAQPQVTPEALQAEYAQLSPEELMMHLQAAQAAMQAVQGAAGPADPAAAAGAPPAPAAPPAGGPPPPPPGASPDAGAALPPPPMDKEELRINSDATGGKISKAEEEIKALKATIEDLKKTQAEDAEALSKAIKIVLETPQRRAITSLSDVAPMAKSERQAPVTRKDVDNLIKSKASKMTKAERDLWLDFVNNKAPASKLENMLERLSSL